MGYENAQCSPYRRYFQGDIMKATISADNALFLQSTVHFYSRVSDIWGIRKVLMGGIGLCGHS